MNLKAVNLILKFNGTNMTFGKYTETGFVSFIKSHQCTDCTEVSITALTEYLPR